MKCIAFDLGGSGGKMFIGNFDGSIINLNEVHRFKNSAVQLGKGLYWDFLYIWKNMCIGLQKAGRNHNFSSLGIDSFCNDFGFVDKQGNLMNQIYSYRDPRTIRCETEIYNKTSPYFLYSKTGNQTAPFSTLMQLASMRIEGDDLLMDHAERLLFIPDLMAYYITNECIAEYTLCSVTQLYNANGQGWDEYILQSHNIPKKLFATVVPPGTFLGKTKSDFCHNLNIHPFDFFSVCEHDTASAFLALPGNRDRAIISSGTWSIVGCEINNPLICDYGFNYNFANEGSVQGHNRLSRNVMGRWILQELSAEYAALGENYDYDQLIKMVNESDAFEFLIDVDQSDFYLPGNMREKIQKHCWARNGGTPETVGQFVRCIYESLALKYRFVIEKMETLTDRSFSEISIIGGGAKDAITCQMTASACNKLVVAGPEDATALGNLLMQFIGYGEIGSIEQGRSILETSFSFIKYEPEDNKIWTEIYEQFLQYFNIY